MKTITCRQLGGPCEFEHHAATADEAIKAQDRHLQEMVDGGDEAHRDALEKMKARWRRPISGMGWYRSTRRQFTLLPDD